VKLYKIMISINIIVILNIKKDTALVRAKRNETDGLLQFCQCHADFCPFQ